MALRMAEYALRIYRPFRKLPQQIVLYVGEPALRMSDTLRGPDPLEPEFSFRYTLVDFRNLDGGALLESPCTADNFLAILGRLHDRAAAIRQILECIGKLDEPARRAFAPQLLIISGLRRLGRVVREEAKKMPVMNSLLEHDLLGPAILEGRQGIVRSQLAKRFGPLPTWAEDRLAALSAAELDELALRLLDALRLEELFPNRSWDQQSAFPRLDS